MKRLSSVFLLAAIAAAYATPVDVTGGWFRKLPGTLPAAGYFIAHNNSGHDLAITGVRSDACAMLMMHKSSGAGGMSSMAMVDQVKILAGGNAAFTPGSYHLMCDTPKMTVGGKVAVTLSFSDGTAVTTAFAVRGPNGK